MDVRDNPKKYYEEERSKLYIDINDVVTKAANDADITLEQGYAFMLSFTENSSKKDETFKDKERILIHLNNILDAYNAQLEDLDTTDEDSISKHKYISGKIEGMKDAIKSIELYNKWVEDDSIV
jgi:hypothetical protein